MRCLAVLVALLALAVPARAAVTFQYPADSDEFTSIGCSGATCLLTGGSEASHGSAVLVMTNGNAGQLQPIAGNPALEGSACASPDLCYAVGNTDAGAVIVPVSGGNVQPTITLQDVGDLDTIACPSANLCFAGGGASDPNSDQQLGAIVPIANGQPGATQFVNGSSYVSDLSCPSESTCVGVASNVNSRNGFFTVGDGQPGNFHQLATPQPNFAGITGVECPAVDDCIGVGLDYAVPIAHDSAGKWVEIGSPSLEEFTCWSTSRCIGGPNDAADLTAVRGDLRRGNDVDFTDQMKTVDGVACPSAGTACYAVGHSNGGPTFGAIATVPMSAFNFSPAAAPAAKCKVPKLTGLTLKKAKKKLKAAHCATGKVKRKLVTKKKSKGKVLSQKPKRGTFAKGKKVALVVGR